MQEFSGKIKSGQTSVSALADPNQVNLFRRSNMATDKPTTTRPSPTTCSLCERPAKTLGLCNGHYNRKWKKRPSNPNKVRLEGPEPRFWAQVCIRNPDECWEWTGARHGNGYGLFEANHRRWRAHRYSLFLVLKRELSGLVLHSCDNPPCVNPSHLREGTAKENTQDMLARNRHNGTKKMRAK